MNTSPHDSVAAPVAAHTPSRKFRKLLSRSALAALIFLTALLLVQFLNSRHPHLGRIYHASAHDLNVARSNPLAKHLSDLLPRFVTQSELYPDRLKDQPKYLRIGSHELEWSIGGETTGWLYFWNPERMPRTYPWQLAQTRETNFLAVRPSSIPATFQGPADQPPGLSTNAISCSAGDIVFARHLTQTNRIYILHLAQQNRGKLSVEYCVLNLSK